MSLNGGRHDTSASRRPLHVACLALLAVPILTPLPAAATDGAYTQDQAARGKSLYSKHYATCHGEALEGGGAPARSGTTFLETWSRPTRTVDDTFGEALDGSPNVRQ